MFYGLRRCGANCCGARGNRHCGVGRDNASRRGGHRRYCRLRGFLQNGFRGFGKHCFWGFGQNGFRSFGKHCFRGFGQNRFRGFGQNWGLVFFWHNYIVFCFRLAEQFCPASATRRVRCLRLGAARLRQIRLFVGNFCKSSDVKVKAFLRGSPDAAFPIATSAPTRTSFVEIFVFCVDKGSGFSKIKRMIIDPEVKNSAENIKKRIGYLWRFL